MVIVLKNEVLLWCFFSQSLFGLLKVGRHDNYLFKDENQSKRKTSHPHFPIFHFLVCAHRKFMFSSSSPKHFLRQYFPPSFPFAQKIKFPLKVKTSFRRIMFHRHKLSLSIGIPFCPMKWRPWEKITLPAQGKQNEWRSLAGENISQALFCLKSQKGCHTRWNTTKAVTHYDFQCRGISCAEGVLRISWKPQKLPPTLRA